MNLVEKNIPFEKKKRQKSCLITEKKIILKIIIIGTECTCKVKCINNI